MMFLHLVDDEKFIADTITLFEQVDPGHHLFVRIIGPNDSREFKYVRSNTSKIRNVVVNSAEYTNLTADLEDFTAVLIHGFFRPYHIHMANTAPPKAVLVWLFWGGEIWMLPRFRNRVLLPLTKGLYYKNKVVPWFEVNCKKYAAFGPAKSPTPKRTRRQASSAHAFNFDLVQAIKRVDYIVPVLEEDFNLLKKAVPCKARRLEWSYCFPEPLTNFDSKTITAGNWLLGNSAHYSNNHVELFLRIRKIEGHAGKLIVPLAYGDDRYRHDVIKIGKRLFGNRFCPLIDFQPYAEYMDLLCSCSAAFFNTCRQQAMGSILPLLYFGTRVFLRPDNPGYSFLFAQGATVYCVSKDIPVHADRLAEPLSPEQIEKNRQVVRDLADRHVGEKKTRRLIETLTADGR